MDLRGDDPYLINGFDRSVVKSSFNILLNAETEISAALAIQHEHYGSGFDEPRKRAWRLVEAVKSRHPKFAGAWGTGIGLLLQCIDGQMCSQVQQLMRQSGRPVLSVHDSFIVEARQINVLKSAMEDVLDQAKKQLANGKFDWAPKQLTRGHNFGKNLTSGRGMDWIELQNKWT